MKKQSHLQKGIAKGTSKTLQKDAKGPNNSFTSTARSSENYKQIIQISADRNHPAILRASLLSQARNKLVRIFKCLLRACCPDFQWEHTQIHGTQPSLPN